MFWLSPTSSSFVVTGAGGQGMHTLRAHPSYKESEDADSYQNIKKIQKLTKG